MRKATGYFLTHKLYMLSHRKINGTDYEPVKKQAADRLASSYKNHTKLTLPNTEIEKLTNKHVESFEKELKRTYGGFVTFSSDVRLGLFDMVFNLGMTKLRAKWPMFNAKSKY